VEEEEGGASVGRMSGRLSPVSVVVLRWAGLIRQEKEEDEIEW
jgi:hypothetical protein